MGDSLNHRAKFDADSFILGGEIRNLTNTQNYKKNKQTVNYISTPCLLACVDNKHVIIQNNQPPQSIFGGS